MSQYSFLQMMTDYFLPRGNDPVRFPHNQCRLQEVAVSGHEIVQDITPCETTMWLYTYVFCIY